MKKYTADELLKLIKDRGEPVLARIMEAMVGSCELVPKGTKLWFDYNDGKITTYCDDNKIFDYHWQTYWKEVYKGHFTLVEDQEQSSLAPEGQDEGEELPSLDIKDQVEIDGKFYTPFEMEKNAIELGIDLSRKFIILKNNEFEGNRFMIGDVITIDKDDNSPLPFFFNNGISICVPWSKLSYYNEDPSQEKKEYIIHTPTQELFDATLKKLKDMGYKSLIDTFSGWEDFKETTHLHVQKHNNYRIDYNSAHCFDDMNNIQEAEEFLDLPRSANGEEEEDDRLEPPVDVAGHKEVNFWGRANQLAEGMDKARREIINQHMDRLSMWQMPPMFSSIGDGEEINKLNNKEPKGSLINKTMKNITEFVKDMALSAEEKLLRKVGLTDYDGSYTEEAKNIVMDLEAKERGFKNSGKMAKRVDSSIDSVGVLEYEALFTKFEKDLLDIAKKYEKEILKAEKKASKK